jgi:hypothetical protein
MDAISRVFFQLDVNYGSLHFRCQSPCVRLATPRSELGQFDSGDRHARYCQKLSSLLTWPPSHEEQAPIVNLSAEA